MVVWLFYVSVYKVRAESSVVVLRGLSAVPTEGSEWIALENTSNATVSGQMWSIRDVQGSIKTWLVPVLQPYELRMFSSTETKISLNNTGDQVELLQGSSVVQSSSPYEELQTGSLWVLLSGGWQEMDADEWVRRWPIRDWQVQMIIASPSPVPSNTPTTVLVSSPSPLLFPSGVSRTTSTPVSKSLEKDWWDDVSLPLVAKTSTQSAVSISTPPIWERPPGDFDGEWQVFQNWKREIWYRLGVTFFSSFFVLALSAPKLYRCYNDLCLLDDG